MRVTQRDIQTPAGRRVRLLLPEDAPQILIYMHGHSEEASACAAALERGGAVALVQDVDWNADLSPWPAPRAFARGEDFSGRADAYLTELVESVLPAVEAGLAAPIRTRAITGYSLAGLFALYAAWGSAAFQRCASMSGSLWYDGFLDHLRSRAPVGGLERCYLSLGDREGRAKDPRIAAVEPCTRAAAELLTALGVPNRLVTHPGGHFRDVPERISQGLLAMVEDWDG